MSSSFPTTVAVQASRARGHYISCPVCGQDAPEYLFHKRGIRFVRCQACALVYVNPTGAPPVNYWDVRTRAPVGEPNFELLEADIARLVDELGGEYEAQTGRRPTRSLLIGRYLASLRSNPAATRNNLHIFEATDAELLGLATEGTTPALTALLEPAPELIILNEALEAFSDPRPLMRTLERLPAGTWVAVVYGNTRSGLARLLRKYWPKFFDLKNCFFDNDNLSSLMAQHHYAPRLHHGVVVRQTLGHFAQRLAEGTAPVSLLQKSPLAGLPVAARTGLELTVFVKAEKAADERESLSLIVPVYNEARSARGAIQNLLDKDVGIPKELIIVESNSTDGTRDIIREFERTPGVVVVYQDRPRGKGNAVRAGLKMATGSIISIHDADFEYDVDDYESLLRPILQHRTSFVLGSRSLGLDDWKIRRFSTGQLSGNVLNVAHLGFAATFNLLYRQSVRDVNTMFKVFRRGCIDPDDLVCDGFDFDIELACKLVRRGFAPIEVPVNYAARGFDEGKKIRWTDAWPSYRQFLVNSELGDLLGALGGKGPPRR